MFGLALYFFYCLKESSDGVKYGSSTVEACKICFVLNILNDHLKFDTFIIGCEKTPLVKDYLPYCFSFVHRSEKWTIL